MEKIIGYHATYKSNVESILKNEFNYVKKDYSTMDFSENEIDWLGDGIYFFTEDINAYKWCIYKQRKTETISGIDDLTVIFKSVIKINKKRIFDLNKMEFICYFEETYKNLKKNTKFGSYFKKYNLLDGIIINYMFDVLKFSERYDVIKKIFDVSRNAYNNANISTRIGIMQEQICVRNKKVIVYSHLMNKKSKEEYYKNILSKTVVNKDYKEFKQKKNEYNIEENNIF